ncbi:hypothetical protein [Thauera sp.]|jgi:hypothetical protein|uniref:hypothetical protein n=1 Tax=Thauera sp. TaxID=1905334 RepID=UPI002A368084|nr:hypothetical protein [Thauera sp.]MDX9886503.1 hypothetical protein [Thauera sp.]
MTTSAEFFEQYGAISMHLRAPMQGDELPITGRYAPTGYKLAVLVYRNDDRQVWFWVDEAVPLGSTNASVNAYEALFEHPNIHPMHHQALLRLGHRYRPSIPVPTGI